MSRRQIYNYVPKRRGISAYFYAPILDGVNLLKREDWKKELDWVNVTFSSSRLLTNPLEQRDLRDIDEELAELDSKFKILKDHLRKSDQDRPLLSEKKNQKFFKHETFLDSPALDGDKDYLRSKAQNVHNVKVPLSQFQKMERHFEKRKAFYPGRRKFKNIKKEGKTSDGEKYVELEFGQIT
jgi:hypothetical protein